MLLRCMLSSTTTTCLVVGSRLALSILSRTSRFTSRPARFHPSAFHAPRFASARSTLATCTSSFSIFHPSASALFPAPGSPQSTTRHAWFGPSHVHNPSFPTAMACAMRETDVGASRHVRPGPRIRGVLKHRWAPPPGSRDRSERIGAVRARSDRSGWTPGRTGADRGRAGPGTPISSSTKWMAEGNSWCWTIWNPSTRCAMRETRHRR